MRIYTRIGLACKKEGSGIPKVPKELGDNKTRAVVLFLLELLPEVPGFPYVVYLDNLFTSTKLFRLLRERGYSAVGTCRTNSGICETFVDQKNKDKKRIYYLGAGLSRSLRLII
jgi:hypothetical protein